MTPVQALFVFLSMVAGLVGFFFAVRARDAYLSATTATFFTAALAVGLVLS